MITVHHGDCREVIPTLGVTVDAVVTDPPYHLSEVPHVSGFHRNRSTAMVEARKGFMGQQWDGGDIAFRPETWTTIGSALRPGGFLVAFGGTRTYHRMASAIEDAGLVIQDCLMWLYANGFPKRRDMLKPAYEPIVLAYKPGGKRTMQVDECRIGTSKRVPGSLSTTENNIYGKGLGGYRQDGTEGGHDPTLGRWPANICHDGSDEVVGLFPDITSTAGNPRRSHTAAGTGWRNAHTGAEYNDSGSAARFFFSAKAGAQDRWGSRHPTVKPVGLMRWLVALVTPPGGTVLDPFAGSGTTAVAALASGRNAILIEREAEYIKDIKERIAFYEGGGQHSTQAKHRNRKVDHGPLFEPKPLSADEDALDSLQSYNVAVQAIGERVKAGGEVPEFMRSRKTNGAAE